MTDPFFQRDRDSDDPDRDPAPFPSPSTALLLSFSAVLASTFVAVAIGREALVAAVGVGQAIGVGAVATLAARRVPEPQAIRLGLQGFSTQLIPSLLFLLPLVFVLSEVDNWIALAWPAAEMSEEAQALADTIDTESLYARVQLGIITIGLAPVVEEWLFRGVIQQGLIAHLGRWRGVLFTAMLFAPLHTVSVSAGTTWQSALVAAYFIGVVLGALRLASGSILAPMLVSGGLNAIGLAAHWAKDSFPIAGFNAPGDHTPALILAPALLVSALGLRPVFRMANEAAVDWDAGTPSGPHSGPSDSTDQ